MAPARLMCRVNARVSTPSIPGIWCSFKKASRFPLARQLLIIGLFSFTINPRT